MPKNNSAIASTIQIPEKILSNLNGIKSKKEATIPIPQTLKIIFLFFFSIVITPEDLVNKNNEL